MRRTRYQITNAANSSDQAWSEEAEAEQIGHVHDGSLAWLNLHDPAGRALRIPSDFLERLEPVR